MRINSLTFLFIFMIILSACDPAQILTVKTHNEGDSVFVYGQRRILPHHGEEATDRIVIHVPFTDSLTQTKKTFLYGIGGWHDDAVENLAACIDSIRIVTDEKETLLNSQEEIRQYLLHHRSGIARHVLTIEAD